MGLIERVRTWLGTVYAVFRGILRTQRDVDVPDQPLKREEIQERERLAALRELDGLGNQTPEN